MRVSYESRGAFARIASAIEGEGKSLVASGARNDKMTQRALVKKRKRERERERERKGEKKKSRTRRAGGKGRRAFRGAGPHLPPGPAKRSFIEKVRRRARARPEEWKKPRQGRRRLALEPEK
jgi:hypothetical protein